MGYEGNPNLFYDIKNTGCTVNTLKVILAHELAFKTYFFEGKEKKDDVKKASKYYKLPKNIYNGINISFSTYIIPNIPIKGKSLVFQPHLVYL